MLQEWPKNLKNGTKGAKGGDQIKEER